MSKANTGKSGKARWTVVAATCVMVAGGALGGCGGVDGVELNGKIFDAMGLSDVGGKKAEPKAQARAPLVVPPDTQKLPEPGSVGPTGSLAVADPAWPKDHDSGRTNTADARKKADQEYCQTDGDWKNKAIKNESGATRCQGSIFSTLGESLFGKD